MTRNATCIIWPGCAMEPSVVPVYADGLDAARRGSQNAHSGGKARVAYAVLTQGRELKRFPTPAAAYAYLKTLRLEAVLARFRPKH